MTYEELCAIYLIGFTCACASDSAQINPQLNNNSINLVNRFVADAIFRPPSDVEILNRTPEGYLYLFKKLSRDEIEQKANFFAKEAENGTTFFSLLPRDLAILPRDLAIGTAARCSYGGVSKSEALAIAQEEFSEKKQGSSDSQYNLKH